MSKVRLLHPAERRGIFTVAQRGLGWREVAIPICDLAAHLAGKRGQVDLYVSQQSFWGWRRIADLAQLGAAYVDLDYHTTDKWAGFGPETVTIALLEALGAHGIPHPSYVLSTGRGLLTVWLHSLVPRKCLPRWMAIQKQLAITLAPFGADRRALDAARVFRLAGTQNSKTGTTVRPTFMAAPVDQLWRWDFEELAFGIPPKNVPRSSLSALAGPRVVLAGMDRRLRGR